MNVDDDARAASALEAIIGLGSALRRGLGALRRLAASEGRVALASVPLLLAAAMGLVAFCVSLWCVVVALVGWLMYCVTHSPVIALGLLAGIHVVLAIAAWVGVRYWLRQMGFPRTRAELRAFLASGVGPKAADVRAGSATRGAMAPSPESPVPKRDDKT